MQILSNKIFFDHKTNGMHPESYKMLEAFPDLQETEIHSGELFLNLVHTPNHIQKVINACPTSTYLDGELVLPIWNWICSEQRKNLPNLK